MSFVELQDILDNDEVLGREGGNLVGAAGVLRAATLQAEGGISILPPPPKSSYPHRAASMFLAKAATEQVTEVWIGDSFGAYGPTTPGSTDMVSVYEAIMAQSWNLLARTNGYRSVEQYVGSLVGISWDNLPSIGANSARVATRGLQYTNRTIVNTGTVAGDTGSGTGIRIFYTAQQTGGAVVNVAINGTSVGTIDSRDAGLAGGTYDSGRSAYFDRPGATSNGAIVFTLTVDASTATGSFEIEGVQYCNGNDTAGHRVIRGDKSGQSLDYLADATTGASFRQAIANIQPEIITISLGVNDAQSLGLGHTAAVVAADLETVISDARAQYSGGWKGNPTRTPQLPAIRFLFQPKSAYLPATWLTDYRDALRAVCVAEDVLFVDGSDAIGAVTGFSSSVAAGSNGVDVATFAGAGTLNIASSIGASSGGGVATVETSLGLAYLTYTGKATGTITGVTTTGGDGGILATGGICEFGGDPLDATHDHLHLSDGASAALAQAMADLTVRAQNRRRSFIQLNTTAVQTVSSFAASINIANASGMAMVMARNDGAATTAGEMLGFFGFGGAYDAYGNIAYGAAVKGVAEGTWSVSSNPARLEFMVVPAGSPGTSIAVAGGFSSTSTLFVGTTLAAAVAQITASGNMGLEGALVIGADAATAAATKLDVHAFAAAAQLATFRAQGTAASPTAIGNGVVVGRHGIRGYDGSAYIEAAYWQATTTQTWSSGANGAYAGLFVTPTSSATPAERIRVYGTPNVVQIMGQAQVLGGSAGVTAISSGGGLDLQVGMMQIRQSVLTLGTTAGLNSNIALPATSRVLIDGATGNFSIGGFLVPTPRTDADGIHLWLIVDHATHTMTIVNEDASTSNAGNRISTGTGGNLTGLRKALLWYDSVDTKWKVLSTLT